MTTDQEVEGSAKHPLESPSGYTIKIDSPDQEVEGSAKHPSESPSGCTIKIDSP